MRLVPGSTHNYLKVSVDSSQLEIFTYYWDRLVEPKEPGMPHCLALRVQPSGDTYNQHIYYMGSTKGTAKMQHIVEISENVGKSMYLQNDMLLEVQIELDFAWLDVLRLKPCSYEDYEIIS